MKTNKLDVSDEANIDGDLTVNGDFRLADSDGEYYTIILKVKSNPNWFQRLVYKLLGLQVIEKDGSN